MCIVLLVSSVRETTKGFVTLYFMLSRIELGQGKGKQNVVVMFVFVSKLAGFEQVQEVNVEYLGNQK